MKTDKIIIEAKDWTQEMELNGVYDMMPAQWKIVVEKLVGEPVDNVYDAYKYHICQYCGNVTKGPDEDVLCEDCRDTFGHAFYSEL